MSNVVVIGAGNVGGSLAEASKAAGHSVTAVTRSNADDAAAALRTADFVVLAVPFQAALELPTQWKAELAGKTVIDATNPLTADFMGLTVGFDTSAGEQVAEQLPQSRVVKAFNSVLAPNHNPVAFEAGSVFVPVAGDDEAAVESVVDFAKSLGFDAVAAGPLKNARYTEPLAELLVQLAYGQGAGTGISVRLQRAN